jgi:outer membrane protein
MVDLDQQQADAAESGLSVIKAETRMKKSKLELVRRIQIDPLTTFSLEPLPENINNLLSLKLDPDTLVALAFQKRSDLNGKELEVKASKWQVTQARSAFYPALDLSFNFGSEGIEYLHPNIPYPPLSDQLANSIGYSVALNLSWAIFDGFQTRYNVESAKINQLNQQLDYEDLKNNILIDLHETAGEYNSALTQIETAKISLKAAKSAFDGVKRKYELGTAGFIELSGARSTFFSARSNLSQATYNLALQKSLLDFTTGNIILPQQPESGISVK